MKKKMFYHPLSTAHFVVVMTFELCILTNLRVIHHELFHIAQCYLYHYYLIAATLNLKCTDPHFFSSDPNQYLNFNIC